jgi:hypothetical protein
MRLPVTPFRRRGTVVGALSLASLLLGVPAGAVSVSRETDACDLLKRSEIADVLGEDAGKPEALDIGDSSCFWELAGADGGGLVVTLFRGRQARSEYDDAEAAYQASAVTEVADLGKEAFSTPIGEVWVLKSKKTAFLVSGVFDAAQSEELARLTLERL